MGQLCPLHPGQEGLSSPGLAVGSTVQPLTFLLHQHEGEAGIFSIQKRHPQMLWTNSLSFSFTSCSFAFTAAAPRGDGPYSSLAHPAAAGHRRALRPLQNSWAAICGVGGDSQTSGPFPHRAGNWQDTSPRSLHMTCRH